MSQDNVELVRRGYAALNAAYKSGDVGDLRPLADEWDPDMVVTTQGGVLAGSGEWQGSAGMLGMVASQMEAFQQMRLEPLEFIEVGDKVVVPIRFGGRARHTGIELEFPAVNVFTFRDGRVVRMETYDSKAEALGAVEATE
jgi:ketosteroid isomerase-like protein